MPLLTRVRGGGRLARRLAGPGWVPAVLLRAQPSRSLKQTRWRPRPFLPPKPAVQIGRMFTVKLPPCARPRRRHRACAEQRPPRGERPVGTVELRVRPASPGGKVAGGGDDERSAEATERACALPRALLRRLGGRGERREAEMGRVQLLWKRWGLRSVGFVRRPGAVLGVPPWVSSVGAVLASRAFSICRCPANTKAPKATRTS